MRLYFNGCSNTYGQDLVDRSNAWPTLVANTLGCDFLNDSTNGGTNDRIVYRTIKHHQDFDKFYIAWTTTTRFTRYRVDNNHEVNFNINLAHSLYERNPEFITYGKLHYAYWHNELFNFKLWLQSIILLQRFFESINKPYVMINSDNNLINRWSVPWQDFNNSVKSLLCFEAMDDNQLRSEWNEIQNLLKQIDYTNYYGWNKWWIIQLLETHPCGPTNHLLEDGHQEIADYILNYDSN